MQSYAKLCRPCADTRAVRQVSYKAGSTLGACVKPIITVQPYVIFGGSMSAAKKMTGSHYTGIAAYNTHRTIRLYAVRGG